MSNLIVAGLFAEGSTDIRFLESVVIKTLEDVAFECQGQIETEVKAIEINKTGLGFVDQVLEASQKGLNDFGIMLLCVHTDADDSDDSNVMEAKIRPAITSLNETNEAEFCKILVSVIPVHMTEAWMLADKELLKSEIGTQKTNVDLGIHSAPESIADPKGTINNAIRIAQSDLTRRKRNRGLDISELYQIIGQKIDLSKLENLDSFRQFKENLKSAFRELGFLH
ncbi:DUF4276 family protein [Flectobacillus longus]|uniref:DUF4276 family protein n=1 Tax=Flectobacillus longus TaxID=2984207 RepID=UPI0024B7D902|nr:DUF4276 family protein [Flectobacillus longus]MDI9878424.1 DUF4276 family protein [Flectobacillus longus]